jgi:hypothetical protein
MGVITTSNFKCYQCATWTEGSTHGGDINTNNEIATSGDQIIFDDVTDAQRQAGVTEYRKIYFKNLNADSVSIKCWIQTAYSATNESISIALAKTTSDTQADASNTGTYLVGDWKTPSSISDGTALDLGTLSQNAYKGVWIKRVVSAGGNGYASDTMALGFGMY